MRIALFVVLVLFAACQTNRQHIEPLAAFDAAVALADPAQTKMPKVFVRGKCGEHFWNELVPYCQVTSGRQTSTDIAYHMTYHLREIIKAMPDVVLYSEGEIQQVGAISQYVGFGISTSTAIFGAPTLSVGYRIAPAVLPMVWNHASGMVRAVRDPSAAGGLIEGDTLLLIGGQEATVEQDSAWVRSPLQRERLKWQPGQTLPAVWIRPGQGRMTGNIQLLPNPRSYASESDSIRLTMPRLLVSKDAQGSPFWRFEEPSADAGF